MAWICTETGVGAGFKPARPVAVVG
jgi:hypothetical protein